MAGVQRLGDVGRGIVDHDDALAHRRAAAEVDAALRRRAGAFEQPAVGERDVHVHSGGRDLGDRVGEIGAAQHLDDPREVIADHRLGATVLEQLGKAQRDIATVTGPLDDVEGRGEATLAPTRGERLGDAPLQDRQGCLGDGVAGGVAMGSITMGGDVAVAHRLDLPPPGRIVLRQSVGRRHRSCRSVPSPRALGAGTHRVNPPV